MVYMERVSIRVNELQVGDRIVRHEYNFHVNGCTVVEKGSIDSAHFLKCVVTGHRLYPGRRTVYLPEGSQMEVER